MPHCAKPFRRSLGRGTIRGTSARKPANAGDAAPGLFVALRSLHMAADHVPNGEPRRSGPHTIAGLVFLTLAAGACGAEADNKTTKDANELKTGTAALQDAGSAVGAGASEPRLDDVGATSEAASVPTPKECRAIGREASEAFAQNEIVAPQCEMDADCEPYDADPCWEVCNSGTWGSEEYQTAYRDAVTTACADFRAGGCRLVGWISCPPPSPIREVRCVEHVCSPVFAF